MLLAIRQLKADKASGFDDLTSESIKFANSNLTNVLCLLFDEINKYGMGSNRTLI